MIPLTSSGHPSWPFSKVPTKMPQALHQAVPPCDTPTRDTDLGSCLLFIAQEVGVAEAGWCSTKLSGYQSKAIAVSCIHRLPLCTAMYTNTRTGPSPPCTPGAGRGGTVAEVASTQGAEAQSCPPLQLRELLPPARPATEETQGVWAKSTNQAKARCARNVTGSPRAAVQHQL